MTIKKPLLLTLVLSCSLAKAQLSMSPLKSLIGLGLGAALLYNLHNSYQNTKKPSKLLAHTAGALASGYLVGDLFQKDSPFALGDYIASGVLAGSLISYERPYPKLWTTTSAFGLGIMLRKLSESDNSKKDSEIDTSQQSLSTPR